MRSASLARMVPDLEALVQSETIAVQAGPRPFEDEALIAVVRQALMAMKALRFTYHGGSRPGARREVTPYGLMFGRANYLVAAEIGGDAGPRNWRLGRIRDIEVLERTAAPPAGFDLQTYANRSFGIYQEDVEDVVLRILPDSAGGGAELAVPSDAAGDAAARRLGGGDLPRQRHARTRLAPLHLARPGGDPGADPPARADAGGTRLSLSRHAKAARGDGSFPDRPKGRKSSRRLTFSYIASLPATPPSEWKSRQNIPPTASASRRTTRSTSSTRRGTMTRAPSWRPSRPECWRSIQRTTTQPGQSASCRARSSG